ncbi:MAG: NAD(P)H-hydrate dehydratase [Rhodospirillaceae bacterium]|jgi:ADP-dependent NAD(P)H-hydrate dehydratase / NAD(P)H-hydrate epimerase|nr:NAD(P)H-hydrate dehydratase [Rhodospirillaceae bacterium]MBT7266739.1 NAD(P)H-hydrate dehydratase [Rhodospirillaceae bacterium]
MNLLNKSELLTVEEMSRADALAVKSGVPNLDLMESAGRSVFRALRKRWTRRRVVVLCGPGNNGGDGFVVARLLKEAGWPVTLGLLGNIKKLKGDAAANAKLWQGETKALSVDLLKEADLVVDALFGAGLTRDIDGATKEVIDAINAQGKDCLAVDVPSGVDGNSGQICGAAPAAQLTVTFFRKKPGHLVMPGRELCGEVKVADIGIPQTVLDEIKPESHENLPANWLADFPRPKLKGHKYARGHVVISGGAELTGAARLAARSARRVGAGLVTIAADEVARDIYLSGDPGCMFSPLGPQTFEEAISHLRRNAVLVGPGNGVHQETRLRTIAALRFGKLTVLDADALTVFEDDPDTLFGWIKKSGGPVVLTPHEGEFARLFDTPADKVTNVIAAAQQSGAVVLLKGADTIIAAPDGSVAINSNAPATLATAGSGDVLAGLIIGLMAQGMTAFKAASTATWMHGEAANIFGPGLIAEDIVEKVPEVLALLQNMLNE